MNARKLYVIAAIVLALIVSALPLGGVARATHPVATVSIAYRRTAVINPGRVWVDPQGTHIRNQLEMGTMTGAVEGTAYVVYNADLNSDGTGKAYGSIVIYDNLPDQSTPAWSGSWVYQLRNSLVVSGEMTALSPGGQWLMQMDTARQLQDGSILLTGVIDHAFCPFGSCEFP